MAWDNRERASALKGFRNTIFGDWAVALYLVGSAKAFGVNHIHPVGGLIDGSPVPLGVHLGLQD